LATPFAAACAKSNHRRTATLVKKMPHQRSSLRKLCEVRLARVSQHILYAFNRFACDNFDGLLSDVAGATDVDDVNDN
jgi:hypothetical protein